MNKEYCTMGSRFGIFHNSSSSSSSNSSIIVIIVMTIIVTDITIITTTIVLTLGHIPVSLSAATPKKWRKRSAAAAARESATLACSTGGDDDDAADGSEDNVDCKRAVDSMMYVTVPPKRSRVQLLYLVQEFTYTLTLFKACRRTDGSSLWSTAMSNREHGTSACSSNSINWHNESCGGGEAMMLRIERERICAGGGREGRWSKRERVKDWMNVGWKMDMKFMMQRWVGDDDGDDGGVGDVDSLLCSSSMAAMSIETEEEAASSTGEAAMTAAAAAEVAAFFFEFAARTVQDSADVSSCSVMAFKNLGFFFLCPVSPTADEAGTAAAAAAAAVAHESTLPVASYCSAKAQ
jgi:hypothetical protein